MTYYEIDRYRAEGGDVGGDLQLSAAPSRTFAQPREDGTWDVITEYAYVVPGNQHKFNKGTFNGRRDGYGVQNQTEIMHCRDANDIGGTEIECDYDYELINSTTIGTMRDALAVARTFIHNLNAEDYS